MDVTVLNTRTGRTVPYLGVKDMGKLLDAVCNEFGRGVVKLPAPDGPGTGTGATVLEGVELVNGQAFEWYPPAVGAGAASSSGQAGAGAGGGTAAGLTPEIVADIKQMVHDFKYFKLLKPQLSLWLNLSKPSIWPTPSKASSGRDRNFRRKLEKFYGNHPHPETQLMKCMITGWEVPSEAIRAGHLIPVRLPAIAKALGVDNINNPRNGLLWCDFIETAFEHWDICFSFGPLPNTLKLHVVNKKLARIKLVALAECKDKDYVNMLGDQVFGSLQEGTIFLASGTSDNAFPMRRAIAWHASAAIDRARTKGLLPDTFKVEDVELKVTSEFDEAETLEAWASMCHEAGPPEEVSTSVEDENEGLTEEELEES